MRSNNVGYLVKKGISSVWKNFIMSFASFSILLVSLLQISIVVLVMMNLNIIMGNIEDTNQIAVFVEDRENETEDAHQKTVDYVRLMLEKNDNVTDIQFMSKEDADKKFREDMAQYAELMDYLPNNPMPETFMIRVKELSGIRETVDAISKIDGVEHVNAPYDFAGALINIRKTFTVIIIAILLALVLVSLVIVSNTIRTSVFARRNEISIMKYVGATNGFIKLPFFVEGVFIGIMAGVASWGLTWFIYDSIFSLFTDNLTLWEMFGFFNLIPFSGVSWIILTAGCVIGGVLGAAGTLITMGRYLKV